jgi:nucleoside-diphosphate-sugar epimerase
VGLEMVVNHVLITGASGFVGQALCPYLTGDFMVWRALRKAERAGDYSIGELSAETNWGEALVGMDAVVHLAGRAHVPHTLDAKEREEYMQVNVEASRNLAKQALTAGVKWFVFISSATVHGIASGNDVWNEQSPYDPQNLYAESKMLAEEAIRNVAHDSAMELIILRPPLIYGPGVKANMAKLIKVIEKGWPMPLGSVHNQRDFLSLTNFCDAIRTVLMEPRAEGTYLLSDNDPCSTPELLRMIADAKGKPIQLIPFPVSLLHLGAICAGKGGLIKRLSGNLRIDISAFQKDYNWTPPQSMAEGIKHMVNG